MLLVLPHSLTQVNNPQLKTEPINFDNNTELNYGLDFLKNYLFIHIYRNYVSQHAALLQGYSADSEII